MNSDILGELLKCLCNPLFELPGNVLSMPISAEGLIAHAKSFKNQADGIAGKCDFEGPQNEFAKGGLRSMSDEC